MGRATAIRSIARVGVSQATVSRVQNAYRAQRTG